MCAHCGILDWWIVGLWYETGTLWDCEYGLLVRISPVTQLIHLWRAQMTDRRRQRSWTWLPEHSLLLLNGDVETWKRFRHYWHFVNNPLNKQSGFMWRYRNVHQLLPLLIQCQDYWWIIQQECISWWYNQTKTKQNRIPLMWKRDNIIICILKSVKNIWMMYSTTFTICN